MNAPMIFTLLVVVEAALFAGMAIMYCGRWLKLRAEVKYVVSQAGDDVCWRDVYEKLATLVDVSYDPELLETSEAMLANCKRFCESMYSGTYTPIFVGDTTEMAKTIVQLQREKMEILHVISLSLQQMRASETPFFRADDLLSAIEKKYEDPR